MKSIAGRRVALAERCTVSLAEGGTGRKVSLE
jgi:hypothetical protein